LLLLLLPLLLPLMLLLCENAGIGAGVVGVVEVDDVDDVVAVVVGKDDDGSSVKKLVFVLSLSLHSSKFLP
jgi:hypothetical protein